jgi:hypothetical protein
MAPAPTTFKPTPYYTRSWVSSHRLAPRDDTGGSNIIPATLGIIIAIIAIVAIIMLLIRVNRRLKKNEAEAAKEAGPVMQPSTIGIQRAGVQSVYGSKSELDGIDTGGGSMKRMELEDTMRHEMVGSEGVRPVEMPAWRIQAADDMEPKSLVGGSLQGVSTSDLHDASKSQTGKKSSTLHWSWSRGFDVY